VRHVRTRVRSPQTNGVIERFFGTLKYEHLYCAPIDDGDGSQRRPLPVGVHV
jgi:transposase InsO family protein